MALIRAIRQEVFDFHWVTDDFCWQNSYISDDAARVAVWIYSDRCAYTGEPAGIKLTNTGCKVDLDGLTLVGNGQLYIFRWFDVGL